MNQIYGNEMNSDSVGKTHELDTVLEALLKEQGFEHKIVEQKVFSAWERVVGDMVARNTQPISLVKSKLTVYALSHPLVAELTFLRMRIIRKLNAEVGRSAVKELHFQIKPPRVASQRSTRSHRHNVSAIHLSEAEIPASVSERVERTVAGVPDLELKTNLRCLFISQSRRTVIDSPSS